MMKTLLGVLLVFVIGTFVWYSQGTSVVHACENEQHKDMCYKKFIDAELDAKGLTAALDALAAAYDAYPNFISTCHAVAHDLGETAYAEFHRSGAVELSEKASYCGYGFYHGFLEELVLQTNDLEEARRFCSYAGSVVPEPPGYAEGACYHGIGHGVTDGTDPRLWGSVEKLVGPGLALCERIAVSNDALYRCASGVFNAIAILSKESKYGIDLTQNPYTLCGMQGFQHEEVSACYDQMNTVAYRLANDDFSAAMRFTRDIADPAMRRAAVNGVAGVYFSNQRTRGKSISSAEVERVCVSQGVDSDVCIRGVVAGIREFGTPGREYDDMLAFCASSEMRDGVARTCYQAVLDATVEFYGSEVGESLCKKIPETHRTSVCRTQP